jgi:hypothetical protein
MLITARAVRLAMVVAAVCFVGVAVVVRVFDSGSLAQCSGTALYASMVYAGTVFLRPRMSPLLAGGIAVGFCWLVEFFQLTGIPATLSAHSVVARLVLGVTFDWTDIWWYPVGVVPLVALDRWLKLRRA